ncbi:MAG TPA: hypothetical protein VH722_10120 [Alphaproteobacteria bacterium]|nr:hypothetical protein [Alphaproteobacteria bacterium]
MTDDAQDPVADAALKIMRHRHYHRALMHYVVSMSQADWRNTPALVTKIMSQGPRIRLVLYIVWLQVTADPANPDDGPTLNRILEICAIRNETSQRAVYAMLGILRLGRQIELVRGSRDKRLKIYRPSRTLINLVKDMFVRSFGAFDIIFENAHWAERAQADDAVFREVYIACGRSFVDGTALVSERFPDLHAVMMMDGGLTVLLQLLIAHLERRPLQSTVALHRITSVSRTQVWQIIRKAADMGLVRLDENGRVVDVSAASAVMARYVATELAFYAVNMDYVRYLA